MVGNAMVGNAQVFIEAHKRPLTEEQRRRCHAPLDNAKAVPSHVRPPIIQFRDER